MIVALAMVLAIQDSTSRCQMEMGQWVCRTTDGRSAYERGRDNATENYNRNFAAGAQVGAQMRQRRLEEEAARQAQTSAALRRNVVTLVRQGDCAGAVSMALDGGDLALATEARQFCTAPPPPPAQ